ncbi:MAG: AmmeMemoRadiSam system protein B [Candidatus Doudnabacteria bacterium]|nr:AmmeMemoRadiSam system protein B [Candidatus Doudnabacteria bacterium]
MLSNAKKIALAAVLILAFVILSKFSPGFGEDSKAHIESANTQISQLPIEAVGLEFGDVIKQSLSGNRALGDSKTAQIGITSHHLPTASGLISRFYKTIEASGSPHKTFVVVGPDHYEHCNTAVSTTKRPYYTPYGTLVANQGLIDDLIQNAAVTEVDSCFDGEHSIGVQSMYIKLLYKDSTIVPIIYSSSASEEAVAKVAQVLSKHKDEITVVVSVDFSHYESVELANQLDSESGNMIKSLDGAGLTLHHMDSPASIRTAIALAKMWGLKPVMLEHLNSFDVTAHPENTTGYWNIIFTENQ